MPDFIVRLKTESAIQNHIILETKSFDPLDGVKSAAAERWIKAVNADGKYGNWQYTIARNPEEVIEKLSLAFETMI